jgi:hypothetical protein
MMQMGARWMMVVIVGCLCDLSVMAGSEDKSPSCMLDQLASDQFEVRDAAYRQLKKWSEANLKESPEWLYQAWKKSAQPEVKTRCYALMKEAVLLQKFGRGKGFVGILMDQRIMGKKMGIGIVQVLPKTPGEKAGLKPGDVIVGIDALDFNKIPKNQQGVDVRSLFQDYVKSKHPDDVITLHLLRGGKKIDKKVTLMKRPASADVMGLGGGETSRSKNDAYFEQWLKQAGK